MNIAPKILFAAAAAMLVSTSIPAVAGHHKSAAQQTIVEKAASVKDFSTLVTAVKAADLATALSADGPFTVFAPTNAAFDALPDGTVAALVKPENKAVLQKILTYHVVAGRVTGEDIMASIKTGGGRAVLTTLQGGKLTASIDSHGALILTDEKGGQSKVTTADISQSNGVIHVINKVVMPS